MKAGSNPIAVVQGADGDTIQKLLAAVAANCRSAGTKVVGVVAEAHGLADLTCSAGFLRDIASGRRYPIYLDSARSEASCHLDAGGVATACSALLDQVPDGDLVVLSKFGKLEAAGQGLFPAFEAAAAAGKPVLTSVSSKHRDAWRAFAPDADFIQADEAALTEWWRTKGEPGPR
ncbi:MAG TPA: DUF2478 domain-containing protein [Alphaproteobacteria bacterium]